MRRTEWLQETRQMRFEEAYGGWQERKLTQEEAGMSFATPASRFTPRQPVAPCHPVPCSGADLVTSRGSRTIGLSLSEERPNSIRYKPLQRPQSTLFPKCPLPR